MAKEAKATYEAVVTAAEALEKENQRPSVRTVTARIGGGSPNVISEYLRKWREERPRIEAQRAIVIDPRLNTLLAEILQKTADEASANAIKERDEAVDEKNLIAQRGVELEREVELLTEQVAQLSQKAQHDAGIIETLKDEAEKARSDAAEEIAQAKADAAAAVDLAKQEAAKERQRADQLVADLAAANVKLTALESVKADLDRVYAELKSEHEQRIAADAKAGIIPRLEADISELRAALKAANEKTDAERAKLEKAQSAAAAELKALRTELEKRIDEERKATAEAIKTAAAATARADALAAQLEAEKSKTDKGAK